MDERTAIERLHQILVTRPRCLEALYARLGPGSAPAHELRAVREHSFRLDSGTRIPDLIIIHSPTQGDSTVLMIEAKTGSLEGTDQTLDYSHIPECEDFHRLVPGASDVLFWFLTPSASLPSNARFRPVDYACLYDAFDRADPDWCRSVDVDLLQTTLPEARDPFALAWDLAFAKTGWVSGQDGNGNAAWQTTKPLKAWKEEWVGETLTHHAPLGDCFNVHLECDWSRPLPRRTVFLHMETNPYRSRRQLTRLGLDQECEERRDRARQEILRLPTSPLWIPATDAGTLCLLKTGRVFDASVGIDEIVRVLSALQDGLSDAVPRAIHAWRSWHSHRVS